MKTNLLFVSAGILFSMTASAYGETCVTNPGLRICVDWDGEEFDPVLNVHFTVDFGCDGCDTAPAVELTGARTTWRVWAITLLPGNGPGNIGPITTTGSGDYEVTIATDFGGAGAFNVGSAVFTPPNDSFSTIKSGSLISGDLGAITVQKDSGGSGGDLYLDVAGSVNGNVSAERVVDLAVGTGVAGGDLTGDVSAQTIVSLTVNGDLNGNFTNVNDLTGELTVTGSIQSVVFSNDVSGNITLGRIPAGATLQIDGTASGDITINGDIEYDGTTKGTVHIGTATGLLTFSGSVEGDVTIDLYDDTDQAESIDVEFKGGVGANAVITFTDLANDPTIFIYVEFLGTMVLSNGLPDDDVSGVAGAVVCFITANMKGVVDLNSKDVAGWLGLNVGGTGHIINGGDVTGLVVLASSGSGVAPFSGDAVFDNVSGTIQTWAGDLDGSLTVDSVASTGSIEVGISADLPNLGGTIHVTNAGAATGAVAAGGRITVLGAVEPGATIEVDGPMKGSVTVKGLASGSVLIDDKLEGGTLTFEGNATSTAYVRVNNMTSVGATHSLVDMQGIFDADMLLDSGIPANQTVQIGGALDLHGEIDLSAGGVAGSLSFDGGQGNVIDGGAVTGSVSLGDGDGYSGTATFSSVSTAGTISTVGTAAFAGTLAIRGEMAGSIGIGGVGVSPSQADLISGGKIWIRQNLTGTVRVGGSLSGDIDVDNSVRSNAAVIVKHHLNATGRILIDGDCDGDISVGKQTAANSLISARNFSGTITINSGEGAFSAKGDISIGAAGLPLPAVAFDGSILVMDDMAGGSGHLSGDINITGCHPPGHGFLDICIEGNELGSVNIMQGTCSDPVCGVQCGGGACP